jgi:predicted secreted Zn-dependent protease
MSYMREGNTSLTWRTAFSCNGGHCVKVAATGEMILVGDSKASDGPILSYTPAEWREFVSRVKNGDFDDLIE